MKLTWIGKPMGALLRVSLVLGLTLAVLAAFNAPARAGWTGPLAMAGPWKEHHHHHGSNNGGGGGGGGGGGSVPEIDPNSMGSALTLLIGGTLALAGRYRRR